MTEKIDLIVPSVDGFYKVDDKRVLYWNGEKWLKAIKDSHMRFSGLVQNLDAQPKNIKSIKLGKLKNGKFVGNEK